MKNPGAEAPGFVFGFPSVDRALKSTLKVASPWLLNN